MAVIKNHFETTLSDDATVESSKYVIANLTAEGSNTTTGGYLCQEAALYFARSIYKTLTDAGYTDALMNEEDYSITVLGFKFFPLCLSYGSSLQYLLPYVYTYAYSNNINMFYSAYGYQYNNVNDYSNNPKFLSYNIIVRGDENCVQIAYSDFSHPNSEESLIFIAKAKNLITSEDAFCYGGSFLDDSANGKVYFKDKDNYSVIYGNVNSSNNFFPTRYTSVGNNTQSKFVCEPILGNYGTYLIYSVLKCNNVFFERGKYYKIGDDLYFCYGYKQISSESYSGSHLLFKVS